MEGYNISDCFVERLKVDGENLSDNSNRIQVIEIGSTLFVEFEVSFKLNLWSLSNIFWQGWRKKKTCWHWKNNKQTFFFFFQTSEIDIFSIIERVVELQPVQL